MRIFYLSKQGGRQLAAYGVALLLLIAGAGLLLPTTNEPLAVEATPGTEQPAAVPFRSGDGMDNHISFAINVDWGGEYLPDMLAVLEENDVTATFFLTGRWCSENAQLAKKIAEAGHELGNHGYSHTSPNASSIEEIIDEITRTEQAILDATGITTRLYAPPSGEEKQHVLDAAASAGYYTVLWSVDTIDWQKPDAATIIQRVTSKIHPGAIILAHPTEGTLNALQELINQLKAEGYIFVPVSDNINV